MSQRPEGGHMEEATAREHQAGEAAVAPLERMKPQDGMWLQDTPTNLMIVNAVFTVDRMDLATLRRLWLERVVQAGDGRRYPRFTKRVVREGRRLYWSEHAGFDIARHVIEAPEAGRFDCKALILTIRVYQVLGR